MDQVIEFFRGLDPLQWVLLAGGIFLLWPTISERLGPKNTKPDTEPDDPVPDDEHPDSDHDLTDLVCKWECFSDACHEAGIHEACSKLKEVFPMLVKPYDIQHDDGKPE